MNKILSIIQNAIRESMARDAEQQAIDHLYGLAMIF